MARKLKSDKLLFLATLLLLGISVVMVYSASAMWAQEKNLPPYHFVSRQIAWSVIGVFLLWVTMRVDYHSYKQPVVIWTAIGMAVCTLALVLFRPKVNGTRRWIGLLGIGLQPSELAKLAAVLFTAAVLDRRMPRIQDLRSLLPIAVVSGALAGLILLQPDYGTAITLLLIVGVMIFMAGLPYRYLTGMALATLPVLIIVLIGAPYRVRRIRAFLDPWSDPLGDGFQTIQSLIAVGSGGLAGRGLMAGVQKLFYLPEPHTDFIYAVIGEELGLLGCTAVLLCFCVIAWRGLRATALAPDRFGAFLAIGITMMVTLQALLNISVVLSLVPNKGIPLPFVSSGGSSMLINLVGMGVLLNVSQHAAPEPDA
jgi:cell division protein FtsW